MMYAYSLLYLSSPFFSLSDRQSISWRVLSCEPGLANAEFFLPLLLVGWGQVLGFCKETIWIVTDLHINNNAE